MNRRSFLKTAGAAGAALAIVPSLALEGCSLDIKGMINAVIAAGQGLLAVAGSAAWVTDLKAALAALQSAEAQWTAGGVVTLVEDALNTVLDVIGAIPLTAVYAPLAAILVAAIDAALNYFVPTTATPATLAPRARRPNVYTGRVSLQKPHLFQTQVGAVKEQWNSQAKMLGLTAAVIE
jgi:hypothetical protein